MRSPTVIALALVGLGTPAAAGGFELPFHGVRSLARGGAFVAGADDADALWQDPAGLAHLAGDGKRALLFDAAFLYHHVDHVRADAAGDPLPAVSNGQPGNLLPALAGALGIGKRLVIAGGLSAPYASVHSYPGDGPQRYASSSTNGSKTVIVTVGAAYAVSDRLRVGATLQDVYTQTAARIVASACPGTTACAPEDPAFDAAVVVAQTDAVSPSASLGVQYDAAPGVTLGAMVQAPWRVSADGTVALELPRGGAFQDATISTDRGSLSYTRPPTVRGGVELRSGSLRVEAALAVELWSLYGGTTIELDHAVITGPGVGTLDVGAMHLPAHDATTFAPAVGVEWHGPSLVLGAGISYETAATPAREVSVRALDAGKLIVGIGGGWEDKGWQIGAAAGAVAFGAVDVAPGAAAVEQLQPLRATPEALAVNAGTYRSYQLLAGLRFARRW